MRLSYVILLATFTFVAGGVVGTLAVLAVVAIPRMPPADPTAMAQQNTAPAPPLSRKPTSHPIIVLVSRGPMTQWSTVREPEEQFEKRMVLSTEAPANFIPAEKIAELKGRRLRSTIAEGTVLSEDHLLKKEVTGIDGMLDKGKRAISIPISADRAVAFFVVPGSKVDVIHTVNGVPNVLLENVLVLAIDLSTGRPENGRATATLQMDDTEQVLKLAAARDRGTLSLVIRPPNDEKDGDAKKILPSPTSSRE